MTFSARDSLSAWGPAVLWAAFIFSMSTDEMSSYHTRTWIEPLVRFVVPGLSREGFEIVHSVIRKLGHVSEYFVLALLIVRGCRRGSTLSPVRAPLAAFVASALYALSDEAHQFFVASRSASLIDCGIDSLGAALAARLTRWRTYL